MPVKYEVDRQNRLVMTKENWAALREVNTKGNRVEWTSDMEVWRQEEKWEFPREVRGRLREDCDGISLYKMRELLKEGFPAGPLTLAVCETETGEWHCVLCVVTDRGDFILDNRQEHVLGFDDLAKIGYRFHYRSTPGKALNESWQRISH